MAVSVSVGLSKNEVREVKADSYAGTYTIAYDPTHPTAGYNDPMNTYSNLITDHITGYNPNAFSIYGDYIYAQNAPKVDYLLFGRNNDNYSAYICIDSENYLISKVVLKNVHLNSPADIAVDCGYLDYYTAIDGYERDYVFYPCYDSCTITVTDPGVFVQAIEITLIDYDDDAIVNSYVDAFLSITAYACSQENVTSDDWDRVEQAFENVGDVSTEAYDTIADLPESNAMVERYKFCIEKYGFKDFLAKGYVKNSQNISPLVSGENISIIAITIFSAVTVTSLAVLFIFHKKKQQ